MLENGLKLILSLKTGRTLARYYFVDPLPRNPDGVGEAVLREARRVKQYGHSSIKSISRCDAFCRKGLVKQMQILCIDAKLASCLNS